MDTYNTKFWCKKVGAKYEQNIPTRCLIQIESCQKK